MQNTDPFQNNLYYIIGLFVNIDALAALQVVKLD